MLYAFTDESYNQETYFQGALVVGESQLPRLEQVIRETSTLAQKFGVEAETEIHGHSIMNASHGWERLDGMLNLKLAIYKKLLIGLRGIDGKLIFSEVSNKQDDRSRHLESQRHLLHKLNGYAIERNMSINITADDLTTKKVLSQKFLDEKDEFPKLLNLEFKESHKHPGIQLIDVALYLYQRQVLESTRGPKQNLEVSKMWDVIADLLE